MSSEVVNSIIIWSALACLVITVLGAHRAWVADHRGLALVPVWLLLGGLFVVPFVLGFLGYGALAVWLGRAFIPVAALFGAYLLVRFKKQNSV